MQEQNGRDSHPFKSQMESNLQTESYLNGGRSPQTSTQYVQRQPTRIVSYKNEYNETQTPAQQQPTVTRVITRSPSQATRTIQPSSTQANTNYPVRSYATRPPVNYTQTTDNGMPTTFKKTVVQGPNVSNRTLTPMNNTYRPVNQTTQPTRFITTAPSPSYLNPNNPVSSNYGTNQIAFKQTSRVPTNHEFHAPVVERKLIYNDPQTGARMMKVCTPNGTVKRIECLDEPLYNEPVSIMNSSLELDNNISKQSEEDLEDEKVKLMIQDAKREFADPEITQFQCEGYPVKVEADRNGERIYYGGESLGLLERREGWLINEGVVHYDRSKFP